MDISWAEKPDDGKLQAGSELAVGQATALLIITYAAS
jgi:hypothetical protein